MKKTLTTITLRAIALMLCFTASAKVYADGTINVGSPTHEPNNGWIFAGDSIVIIRNGNYTVTGSTARNRIVTADSVTATITLDHADITSSVNSPFRLSENGTKGSDVTLILAGANRLIVDSVVTLTGANKDSVDYSKPYSVGYAGLTVEGKARLTIRTADGSDGSGSLTAGGAGIGMNIRGEVAGAGIGAGAWTLNGRKGAGDITINSGTVVATGGEGGAGIGGGTVFESAIVRNGGNVVINGGAITANGGIYGAGIGAGAFGGGGSVTINGGVIAANGGTGGPAIGSGAGAREDAGIITICGGMVRAYGGVYATGIGGGYESAGGIITISGGTIVAHTCGATDDPAGIGGSGEAGIIRISGGTVLATGGTGPGIGGGHGKNGGSIDISGGIVIADQIGVGHHGRTATTISGSQTVVLSPQINGITASGIYGGATVLTDSSVVVDDYTSDMILKADLTLPSGVTLFVPKGRKFTNNGAITNYGAIINRDTIFNYGTITDDGLVINKGIFIGNRITTADLLSMSGWKYGEAPKSAVLRIGKHDGATSVIEYKKRNAPDNAYTSAVPKDAGDYTVREKYAGSQVYNDLLLTADFAIDKVPLTVTAKDKSRAYGAANPAFTVTYSGFVNGETESVLTAAPTAQTSANATSPAGTYAIIPSGGEAANYTFKYVAGTLTVTPATPAPNPSHLVRFRALLDDSVKRFVEFTPAADTVMRKREGDAILFVIKVKDGVQLTAPELFINNSKRTLFRGNHNSWFLAIVVGKEDVDIAVMGLHRIPAGIEEAESAVLHAVPTNNGLMLTGLVPGEMFGVYNMQGQLFYKGKATSGKERIPLRDKGVYIVVAGDRTVKTVY